jgi:cell division protein ZapE
MGRTLPVIKCSDRVIWLSFACLCQTPRGYSDYLEIARTYPTLILEGIIQMGEGLEDVARRFMSLIDILYDHRVKMIA